MEPVGEIVEWSDRPKLLCSAKCSTFVATELKWQAQLWLELYEIRRSVFLLSPVITSRLVPRFVSHSLPPSVKGWWKASSRAQVMVTNPKSKIYIHGYEP